MPTPKFCRMLACLALAGAAHAQVRYVDDTATGANDGTSWANAFVLLQSALAVAGTGSEVWVAEGVYKPSVTGSISDTFTVQNGVAVYGGFAGTETSVAQRVVDAHPTILSGDLAGDSGLSFSNLSDNSVNVVRIVFGTTLTRLDGLIIQGGNSPGGNGGGITLQGSMRVIHGCVVRFNHAGNFGGGVFCDGNATVTSCLFHDNVAQLDGGALDLEGSQCVVSGSRFIRNTATFISGGAIWVAAGIDLSSCVFSGNSSAGGAGIYTMIPTGSIRACTFYASSGPDISGGPQSITNCIFSSDAGVAQFADPLGADGIAGTLDDDLRLLPTSPFIDAGDNTQVTASMLFDVAGLPRQVDDPLTPDTGVGAPPLIDRGAHEYQPCPAPTNYCVGAPNSVGPGATMGFVGSAHLYAHEMRLTSSGLPPLAVGLFFHGNQAIQVPFANGFRCVGGTIARIGIVVGNANGVASVVFDPASSSVPIGAGTERVFQHWYRNPAAGGAGSNLSDGLRIVFCP